MLASLDSRTVSNPSSTAVGTRIGFSNLFGTFPSPPIPLPGEQSTPPASLARNARLRPRVAALGVNARTEIGDRLGRFSRLWRGFPGRLKLRNAFGKRGDNV